MTLQTRVLSFIFLSGISQILPAQQKFPKVMSVILGQIVDPRWEENELHYYDAKGQRIRNFSTPTGTYTIRYMYVDSTGAPINKDIYDKANGFFRGLAVVQTPGDYNHDKPRQYAVLNEKGEYVFPYSKRYIENMSGGLVKISSNDTTVVFDAQKKQLASCFKCDFSLSSTGRNIYQMPHPYSKDPAIIKLFDLSGKQLYETSGYRIGYVSNNVVKNKEPYSRDMPYHVIERNANGNIFSIVSDGGQLMLDSIDNFVFNQGISCITRNGKKGFVVDSMFHVMIPSSYGHDRYWPLFTHPKKAFVAWRNDSVMAIDHQNKYLVKPMMANYLEFDTEKKQYDVRNTNTGDQWILSLNGDTIASPSRYFEYSDMRPGLPGAMVRCKPDRLKGYVNDLGQTVIPCKYTQLAYGGPGRFLFFTDNSAGYLDITGKKLFTVDSAIFLSNFSSGYAIFAYKKPEYRYGSQRVISAEEAYSVVYKMIDSTGKVISEHDYDEISKPYQGYIRVRIGEDVYLVDLKFNKVLTKDGHQLVSYFCKGIALAYDPAKNKIGLVNEKLETVLPVIYDWIDTADEEGNWYGYGLTDRSEHPGYSYNRNACARIINNKIQVKIGENEMTVELRQK